MEDLKISVLIPVYGVEPYLKRCIDSVIRNTYRNLEIICVNDGSKDGCPAILQEYARKDPRIRVIDKPNGGLPSARNAAIDAATGDYIAHVDGDDWVHPQYFECLMEAVCRDNGKTDIAMCGFAIRKDGTGNETDPRYDPAELEIRYGSWEIIRENPRFNGYVWGKLYRRSVIGSFRQPLHISLMEDVIYNAAIQAQNSALRVAVTDAPLYRYFDRPGSIVHTVRYGGRNGYERIRCLNEILNGCVVPEAEAIVGTVLLKQILSVRYSDMFLPACVSDYRSIAHNAFSHLGSSKSMKKSLLLALKVMFYCPVIYRVYRIATDWTMLAWERQEKQRCRIEEA